MAEPQVRVALGRYPHTEPIHAGTVGLEGFELDLVPVDPIIAAFRRMVRELAYDVCELAPTTYLIAREAGVPITALPVFLMRRFHHADVLCRAGTGIREPADLEGRRVGVRAYSVTTGVWVRGLLAEHYDVDHRAISWRVDDDEHVATLRLPDNVTRLGEGDSLASAFGEARIDAAFGGRAGIGRVGGPAAGWTTSAPEADHYPLFADAADRDRAVFAATGVYPLHGLVCVRTAALQAHPDLAAGLWDMLVASKAASVAGSGLDAGYAALSRFVGPDPLPWGLEGNRVTLEALQRYALDQGLITTALPLDELFLPFG